MLFVLLFCSASVVDAQESYKWKDADGKTVYGSKPPANAKGVERFSTRKLSKYSSNQVLKRAEGTKEDQHVNVVERKSEKGEIFQDKRIGSPVGGNKTRSIVSGQLLHLKPATAVLTLNQLGEITSCEVEVFNEGEVPAQDVSVAFEFFEGTLIPGTGSFVIAPGTKEKYSVPDTLLPLYFSVGDLPEEEAAVPSPRVIVHGASY